MPKTPLGEVFAVIIVGICNAVAAYVAGAGAQAPFLVLLHHRLRRTAYRLDRLVAHWQAGTLPALRPSPARATRPDRSPAPHLSPALNVSPALTLSRSHRWVFRHAQRSAQYVGQVEAFLAHPDTRALLLAAPQAGRLLRPLCRIFAIAQPPWLALPPCAPLPCAPRSRKPVRARPPAPPPAQLGTPDRPLPAYIIAAARAWRKKSG